MRVWKYHVPIQGEPLVFSMPLGATPVAVQIQRDDPCMWVTVNPGPPYVERSFRWVGTGHDFDQEAMIDHVGTVQTSGGAFVWHLFEVH